MQYGSSCNRGIQEKLAIVLAVQPLKLSVSLPNKTDKDKAPLIEKKRARIN